MILTLLAALATIANVVRLDGINIMLELAVLGVPAVFLAALVRLAPGYGYWSDDLRSRAVITGATITFLYVAILPAATSAIRDAAGWSVELDYRFYWLVSIPVALCALTVGCFSAQRRIGQPEQRGRGLLFVIVGVLITIAGLPGFLSAANLPAVFPQQHFSLLNGLQVVAAVGTLILADQPGRAQARRSSAAQLANLLALLAGLQIIRWILDLLNEISSLSTRIRITFSPAFLVLTVFWGFAMSGEES